MGEWIREFNCQWWGESLRAKATTDDRPRTTKAEARKAEARSKAEAEEIRGLMMERGHDPGFKNPGVRYGAPLGHEILAFARIGKKESLRQGS